MRIAAWLFGGSSVNWESKVVEVGTILIVRKFCRLRKKFAGEHFSD